jgi:hypothetical protein
MSTRTKKQQRNGKHVRIPVANQTNRYTTALGRSNSEFKLSRLGLLSDSCKISPYVRLLDWRFFGIIGFMVFCSMFLAYCWHLLIMAGLSPFADPKIPLNEQTDMTFIWGFTSLAISVSLNKWLWESIQIYFERITVYVSMMHEIMSFLIEIEANYDYNNGRDNEKKTIGGVDISSELMDLKNCMLLTTQTTQFIFLDDNIRMYNPSKMNLDLTGCSDRVRSVIEDRFNDKDPISTTLVLISEIQRLIMIWIKDKKVLLKNDPLPFVDSYRRHLKEIQVTKSLQSFKIFKYIVIGVVFMNLLLVPPMLWTKLTIDVIYIYPIITITFLAIPAAILWMGDPFEGDNKHNAYDREYTEMYIYQHIEHTFNNQRLSRISPFLSQVEFE